MNILSENIKLVNDKIGESCIKTGRSLNDITVIAVSKTISPAEILKVHSLGIRNFGENKVQELMFKIGFLPETVHFHLIGHLQTNKVKQVIGKVKAIQSVDSIKLANEINDKSSILGLCTDCLIQINTSREESKFGVDGSELEQFIEKTENLSNIRFKGLMTIGTFTEDEKEIRRCFIELRELKEKFEKIIRNNLKLTELSMGMSGDYHIAVEEGSTILRIGTAIFGMRNNK